VCQDAPILQVCDGAFDSGSLRGDQLVELTGVHAKRIRSGTPFGHEWTSADVAGIGEPARAAVGMQAPGEPLGQTGSRQARASCIAPGMGSPVNTTRNLSSQVRRDLV
jgi:hypothetical protein